MTLFDPSPEPSEGQAVRVRMTVAYDGSGLRGFAAQPGQPTVAGVLGAAIEKVVGHPVRLTCAGRTDAGVHALGQVVHADLRPRGGRLDLSALVSSCNKLAGPKVAVVSAEVAPEGFDARRSALSRRYRYAVWNSPVPNPLIASWSWQVADSLDLRSLRAGADTLVGEHDFAAFCRRPPGQEAGRPQVRRVLGAGWKAGPGPLLAFEIEAGSFCHQMVRSLVGALVEVGRGRMTVADLVAVLRSGDRSLAPSPAPAHGLCLLGVSYPGEHERTCPASSAHLSWPVAQLGLAACPAP